MPLSTVFCCACRMCPGTAVMFVRNKFILKTKHLLNAVLRTIVFCNSTHCTAGPEPKQRSVNFIVNYTPFRFSIVVFYGIVMRFCGGNICVFGRNHSKYNGFVIFRNCIIFNIKFDKAFFFPSGNDKFL